MKESEETPVRRSRRRPAGTESSHAVFDRTRPYRHLRNPFAPMKVFSDDQVAAIHESALLMLERQGMKVLSEDARVLYRNAGADVDEATLHVRIDRKLIAASLADRALRHHAARPRSGAPRAAVEPMRGLRPDLGAAEHHGHGRWPARPAHLRISAT